MSTCRSVAPGAIVWRISDPVHFGGVCDLRYDNESGKGDHRHFRGRESRYAFEDVDKLLAAFERDIERIHREDRDA